MANVLDKDPETYAKERDGFLRDLQHFHETRGTPFKRTPKIGGHHIDLYLLYTLVTDEGGWIKVNSKGGWTELFPYFHIPSKCVNASIALKQIYLRYLDRWEKVHHLGEEADRGSDDDEESRHRRWSARALHSVPTVYNYHQHNIAESAREYNQLSTNLYKASDYDRLGLSLLSSLPNEQDFAINVCTLLSSDGKHTLKLDKHPRILDYLCAHAGVFHHGSLRRLFIHNYTNVRKHDLHTFWKHVVEGEDFLELTKEAIFTKDDQEENHVDQEEDQKCSSNKEAIIVPNLNLNMNMNLSERVSDDSEKNIVDLSEETNTNSDCEYCGGESSSSLAGGAVATGGLFKGWKWKKDGSDKDLFCLGTSLGTREYVGQRILQIATILRNLSFIEDNISLLVNNQTFVRFVLLCSCAQWGPLRNLGLDMLGNIAIDYKIKDPSSSSSGDKISGFLLKIVAQGLESEDRAACISSLEVLNKLSQNELNEDVLLRTLESGIYTRVCSFLTIHDVMLLIYTLECLYSLSSLGERACNYICNNHGVIDTLVSLVTVEGKSYGPKACIGMKLVETVTGGSQQQNQTNQNSVAATTTTTNSPSSSAASSNVNAMLTPLQSSVVNNNNNKTIIANISSTPHRPSSSSSVSVIPQRLFAVTSSPAPTPSLVASSPPQTTAAITPQQLVQQQHAHQQAIQENEQFALAWLRATYEPVVNGRVDHQELYKHYINSCAKIGRRGVIAPLHFPRCVRSVFGGTVGPNPVKPANSSEPQFYDGIKVRAVPLVISVQTPSLNQASSSSSSSTSNTNKQVIRRTTIAGGGGGKTQIVQQQQQASPITVIAESSSSETPPASPASPILKAQLSAPPKQSSMTTTTKDNSATSTISTKSQIMAHPHLSQALLGSSPSTSKEQQQQLQQQSQGQSSNTSLIKSLLATKVTNDCMTSSVISMRSAADCQNVVVSHQVVARQQQQQQQRLLLQAQQQQQQQQEMPSPKCGDVVGKGGKLNGARQLFSTQQQQQQQNEEGEVSSTTTTHHHHHTKSRREPPQPPPPPLAPLTQNSQQQQQTFNQFNNSLSQNQNQNQKNLVNVNNDENSSNSTGNNSLASSSNIGLGGVSSTEEGDGENSLTSFEGILLNGAKIPSIDDSTTNSNSNSNSASLSLNKPLMLADLLEKKPASPSPITINGLVESHIDKALKQGIKRPRPIQEESDLQEMDEEREQEAKKPHLNGNSSSNDQQQATNTEKPISSVSVSTAAAKLFADIAADILEDEEEEESQPQNLPPQQQQQQNQTSTQNVSINQINHQIPIQNHQHQVLCQVDSSTLMAQPRIIVSSSSAIPQQQQQQQQQMLITSGGQLKTIVQSARAPQFSILPQGQLQLVASSASGGQYVLQTGSGQGAYVVAQSQTAVVHGQPQTVLVAQTPQQQGTGTKTIIILQQQPSLCSTSSSTSSSSSGVGVGGGGGVLSTNLATHHQKIVVTPQGQQVVVTQVPRPQLQQPTVSTSIGLQGSALNIVQKTTAATSCNGVNSAATAQVQVQVQDKKAVVEETPPKPKIIRDLTNPYVCEWGDCMVETKFTSANQVFMHACETHCPESMDESVCLWDRCDNMKRKRFSLMTHLFDKHCNNEAMKNNFARRKQQASQSGKPETPTPSVVPSSHPGYAPDAALHAIKRHALEFVNPKELQRPTTKPCPSSISSTNPGTTRIGGDQDDNEGPVTKSIRLTASLILRNLVIYSSTCRRYLKHHEPHLANVALSNVESSRTIAQVLYDMNDGTTTSNSNSTSTTTNNR